MIPARWNRPDTGGDDRGGALLLLSYRSAKVLLILDSYSVSRAQRLLTDTSEVEEQVRLS